MSRNIDFIMQYPYFSYTSNSKYGYMESDTQERVNSCDVWPYVFNNPIPRCQGFRVGLYVEKDPDYTRYVTDRDWYIYVYRYGYGWSKAETVYVLEAEWVYADVSLPDKTITKVVATPSYTPSSYTQWFTSMTLENMRFATNLNTLDLTANGYFKNIMVNRYGIDTSSVNELSVNLNGIITKAKQVFVNTDGNLTEIPHVPSGRLQTINSEDFAVFEFIPQVSGDYTFSIKQSTGDHDGWLYDSSFNLLNETYFDTQTFTLSQGSVYYILLMQYYTNTTPADSVLQVITEG